MESIKTLAQKLTKSLVVVLVSTIMWPVMGLVVNVGVGLIPEDERFVSGPITIGGVSFELSVLLPMLVFTALLLVGMVRSLAIVWKGGTLKEALTFALLLKD